MKECVKLLQSIIFWSARENFSKQVAIIEELKESGIKGVNMGHGNPLTIIYFKLGVTKHIGKACKREYPKRKLCSRSIVMMSL